MILQKRFLFLALLGSMLIQSQVYGEVLNIKNAPFSAVGDGKTDDRPAFSKALAAMKAGDTLVIPEGDYRLVLKSKSQLNLPEGTTLLGQGGKSRILLSSEDEKHREFLRFNSNTVMEGISVVRDSAFSLVMFPVFGNLNSVTIRNCTIDGNKEKFPKGYCHVIQVGVGEVDGLVLERSTIRNSSYGLFQANPATGKLRNVLVEHCLFEKNFSSDLEFNSPNGKMEKITVRDCLFRDNQCKTPSAGFAVGFANVTDGRVENCVIRNYMSEALHVEDRSKDVALVGNTIVSGSTVQDNGVILIVNNSKETLIENNVIDARANTNRPHLILVTAGGDKFPNPSGTIIRNNVLLNGPETRTWYLQNGSSGEPENNAIVEAEK